MSVKTDNPAEYLLEAARKNGVACSTVKDGHILVFSKSKLKELIDASEGAEEVILFVKRPNFNT